MTSVFEFNQSLESINNGVGRFDCVQVYPLSGNVSNCYVGSGDASQKSSFQWIDNVNFWSPSMSYFLLQLKFIKRDAGSDKAIPDEDLVTYCDNFVCTLFSQIKTTINSRQLDYVDSPWLVDTILTVSNSKKNFISTFGSLTRVGESLMDRLANVKAISGTDPVTLEVVFRPPCSLFGAKLLPPGAQFLVEFLWAANASLAFESLLGSPAMVIGTANGNYNVKIDGFSFYKSTLTPSKMVPLPDKGVIDLSPTIVQQYFLNAGSQLKQNITLPPTCNRIIVGLQDINQVTASYGVPGVGSGYNPATQFTTAVSNIGAAPTPRSVELQNAYISLPELGFQWPSTTYQFNGLADWMRAYSDFCNITQGTNSASEGSIEFGSKDTSKGITINAISGSNATTLTGFLFQVGDPFNRWQYFYNVSSVASLAMPATTIHNQTCLKGYLGRYPLLAFPVVRNENKTISQGLLNLTFNGPVASCAVTVASTYSMAIAVEQIEDTGIYNYTLIEGV